MIDPVKRIAEQKRATPAQVALAWLLRQPGVTAPIVGATRMEHLDQAIDASEIELGDEECRELEELYEPHPVKM
jgi:aryl-alcohol dehydrogenase (NADP+)